MSPVQARSPALFSLCLALLSAIACEILTRF
jgi:hypothetical protein